MMEITQAANRHDTIGWLRSILASPIWSDEYVGAAIRRRQEEILSVLEGDSEQAVLAKLRDLPPKVAGAFADFLDKEYTDIMNTADARNIASALSTALEQKP